MCCVLDICIVFYTYVLCFALMNHRKEPPIISYEYANTIASKLFNFASTLSNLDITYYLSSPHSCQCETSEFCYKPHGHVVTGDLMAIENVKLRELVSKSPKYQEPNKINWSATEKILSESIHLYAERWAKREQVNLKQVLATSGFCRASCHAVAFLKRLN